MRNFVFKRTSAGTYAMPEIRDDSFLAFNGRALRLLLNVAVAILGLAYAGLRKVSPRRWALIANRTVTLGLAVMVGLASVYSYRQAEESANVAMAELAMENASVKAAHACLAEALFWEGERGNVTDQRAIARNILTRMASGDYPSDLCKVISEKRIKKSTGQVVCMYTFKCDNRPAPSGREWKVSQQVAAEELKPWYLGEHINGSINYFAHWMDTPPTWAVNGPRNCELAPLGRIGAHLHFAAVSQPQQRACRAYKQWLAQADKAEKPGMENELALPKNGPIPSQRPGKADHVANLLASL